MPASWRAAFGKLVRDPNREARSRTQGLAVTFGDPQVLAVMRKLLVTLNAMVRDAADWRSSTHAEAHAA